MERSVETIKWKDQIIALIVRNDFKEEGVNFLVPESFPLQLGVNIYQKDHVIKSHKHHCLKRHIKDTQEMIHIDEGKIELYLYNSKGDKIKTCILNKGDTALFASGGHGWKMLEKTKIIEVKQGPYYGVEDDKKYLH